jgi:hypothetical protein
VRAAGDREWGEVLIEGLAELRRGLEGCGDPGGMLSEATRYVMSALLKGEDVGLLATVLGAPGKSVAAMEERLVEMGDVDRVAALVLALVVRRMRYEGAEIFLEDDASPLARIADLARFDAGSWHKKLKRRREAAMLDARASEETKLKDRAQKAIESAARMRKGDGV